MKTTMLKTTLTCLAIVISVPAAAETRRVGVRQSTKPDAVRTRRASATDIALDARGHLTGYLLDQQGRPVREASITIRQGSKRVAQTRTSREGKFVISGIRGGVYQVLSDKGSSVIRVWTQTAAPRNARRLALVIQNSRVVRGQSVFPPAFAMDFGTLASTGVAVGGATMGVIASQDAQDAEDKAAELQTQVTALEAQVNSLSGP